MGSVPGNYAPGRTSLESQGPFMLFPNPGRLRTSVLSRSDPFPLLTLLVPLFPCSQSHTDLTLCYPQFLKVSSLIGQEGDNVILKGNHGRWDYSQDGRLRRPPSDSMKIMQFCHVFERSEKQRYRSRKLKQGLPSFKSER